MKQNKYRKPIVVSEIGCNHRGQIEIAKELILLSKQCKADYAKFQKRNNKELLTPQEYNEPHPVPHNSYGDTYGRHRDFLEFSIDQHAELKEFSEENGIGYATSVWDISSAREISRLNPDFIKIPSACNNHFELLKVLRDDFSGDVHISTGMTTKSEIEQIVSLFEESNQATKRLILYNCTSGYPVSFEDVCLLEIDILFEKYQNRVKDIGFSGHHLGIAIDIAAYTLGVRWIERHFTKNRTWKGTDHAASLEVPGLATLIRDLNSSYSALKYKNNDILEVELEQRNKLKYGK